MAIPSFWLGLTMILLTVTLFNWRPSITIVQLWEDPATNLSMVLGPTVAMGIGIGAIIARMTRSTVLEVLGEDYVRTARQRALRLDHNYAPCTQECHVAGDHPLWAGARRLAWRLGRGGARLWLSGLGSALAQAAVERDWMMVQNLTLILP
ncbi:MAG: hypothetical protein R2932_34885 [Caldilineaceae bacterium]